MIPVPRLAVHVKRLVAAGYKVGVCRQTETRALKATTENANKPFSRALTALYTASTWIDEIGAVQSPDELGSEQVLISVAETPNGTRTRIGLAAVDIATASVTYDVFSDDALRSVCVCTDLGTRDTPGSSCTKGNCAHERDKLPYSARFARLCRPITGRSTCTDRNGRLHSSIASIEQVIRSGRSVGSSCASPDFLS